MKCTRRKGEKRRMPYSSKKATASTLIINERRTVFKIQEYLTSSDEKIGLRRYIYETLMILGYLGMYLW